MIKKITLILFFAISICSLSAFLPDPDEGNNAKIKAIYIYNFTKYVEWPPESKSGNFVVGISGTSATLFGELNKMASTKKVGSQTIEIINLGASSDAAKCHIVYVANNSNLLPDIISKVKGKNTLIVTENSGLTKQGAGISFVLVDSKQKIELNKANIESHNLKVANSLEQMAVK
jgi:hypothetical protein